MSLLLLGAFEFHSLLIHKIYNIFSYNIVTLFGCDNFLSCRNIKIKQTNCKNIVPCLSFLKVILIMKNNIFLKIKQRMNWPWPLVHRALYNKMGCTALSITQWGHLLHCTAVSRLSSVCLVLSPFRVRIRASSMLGT